MNSDHLRVREGNILDICTIYITGAHNIVNKHNLSAGQRSTSHPCALRVRLGRRHGGPATSCFCADPCTQSVQDLNRPTCLPTFGTNKFGTSIF